MTTPNKAREAAEKIMENWAPHSESHSVINLQIDAITAIIEEITRVGVKEEVLKDLIWKWRVDGSRNTIEQIVLRAEKALGDKPETPE